MGQTDASRIEVQEGAYTFTRTHLDDLLRELDARITAADCWLTITRPVSPDPNAGLITKTEYFADAARTKLVMERQFDRSPGLGGVRYISQITTIFYNENGTEDSRVTATISRPGLGTNDDLTTCDSPFSTTESTKL